MFTTIEDLLTKYVDQFKVKNPVVFGIFALTLIITSTVVVSGVQLGLFEANEATNTIVTTVNAVLDFAMISLGAHTTGRLVKKAKENEANAAK